MKCYDQLVAVLRNNPNINAPINPEHWPGYAEKGENLSPELTEQLYALILHYNALSTGKIVNLPYGARTLSSSGGVGIQLNMIPAQLQHLIIAFLERV